MKETLLIVQMISGLLICALILIQVKGTGFGRVWGGLSASSSRRGLEQLVFKLSFIVSAVFIIASLIPLFI